MRLTLFAAILLAAPASAGKKVPNAELIVSSGSIALTGHRHPGHLSTFKAQVGADVSDSSDHLHYADLHAATSQTDCDADGPSAWGDWYDDLTTAEQGGVCDLIRGQGSFEAKVRIHLEATLTDTTSDPITPSELSALVSATSQSQFDTIASGYWPGLWATLGADERQALRALVLEVGQ